MRPFVAVMPEQGTINIRIFEKVCTIFFLQLCIDLLNKPPIVSIIALC